MDQKSYDFHYSFDKDQEYPMKLIRVAAAALNQTPLDWEGNASNIRAAIEAARKVEARLLCLPELCITGYGCEDAFYSHAVVAMGQRMLFQLLPLTRGMAVSVGLPVLHLGALYNASAFLVDGRLAGVVAKQRLAGDGLHYEPRWFKPWPSGAVTSTKVAGVECPFGELLFELDDVRIGFEICEDAWVADRPAEAHARHGVDVILNPSASHFAFGKERTRRHLVTEASRIFGVTYLYANLVGNEAGRAIYDGHTLVATSGELVASGPRLSFLPALVTDAIVDIDATRMRRSQSASYVPAPDVGGAHHLVKVGFQFPPCEPAPARARGAAWEAAEHLQYEEFARAISLALYDYLRKSRSKGFVVSLSGGADSTAVVGLVALMVRFGCAELGMEEFVSKAGLQDFRGSTTAELVARLLTTVYQATRNSSAATRHSARTLAEALGAEHFEFDVDDVCASYTKKVEQALGRSLDWKQDDVALQNIQARVRGPAAWMLANVKNALLLATSNRSEAAVGYATMDGDTCGGISPIAGIDKAFLRRWLRWMEMTGPVGVGPIAAVRMVNELEPTAELRPLAAAQTDESDLMPYELLDAIEHQAIGEKRSPQDVLDTIAAEFTMYGREQLAVWVRRFFELWSRNQWKRERYAPSFHVDDKNLDPKTWCRFPILSGGFRMELAELDSEQ